MNIIIIAIVLLLIICICNTYFIIHDRRTTKRERTAKREAEQTEFEKQSVTKRFAVIAHYNGENIYIWAYDNYDEALAEYNRTIACAEKFGHNLREVYLIDRSEIELIDEYRPCD